MPFFLIKKHLQATRVICLLVCWYMNTSEHERFGRGGGGNQGGAARGVSRVAAATLSPTPCLLHILQQEYNVGLGGSSKHCLCSTSLSNLVCIISSRGIDTNKGTLDILKMVAQYSVYLQQSSSKSEDVYLGAVDRYNKFLHLENFTQALVVHESLTICTQFYYGSHGGQYFLTIWLEQKKKILFGWTEGQMDVLKSLCCGHV